MLKRTITKFCPLVILSAVLWLSSVSCSALVGRHGRPPEIDRSRPRYGAPAAVGKLESAEITESSGLAASKCQNDVLWTHNDSGDGPFLFAIDAAGGHLGVWRVRDAANVDWEDIAAVKEPDGRCFVYIGEIGNSAKEKRDRHRIYRVPEPEVLPSDSTSTRAAPRVTATAEVLEFKYPDRPNDAETLMVHPKTLQIYVVTRHRSEPAGIYSLENKFGDGLRSAVRIGEITVPAVPFGFLTGGDIAPDGRRLILCDHFAAYELILPADAGDFSAIWQAAPFPIDLGNRKQGESVAYSPDGTAVLSTSEGVGQPLIRIELLGE